MIPSLFLLAQVENTAGALFSIIHVGWYKVAGQEDGNW